MTKLITKYNQITNKMDRNNKEIKKVGQACAEMKSEGWGGGAPLEDIISLSQLKESVVLDTLKQLNHHVYTDRGTILVDVSDA
jgi:myosin heavy subunit